MKFNDLITRLENYLKENPERLNNDIILIANDLQEKYREYKRIKKAVFKRQVEKAYGLLAKNETFVETIEKKIDEANENIDESGSDDLDGSLDEQALGEAIRGENTNEINNMITDIYKSNNKPAASAAKSNLKVVSMFDSEYANIVNNKKVQFSLANNNNNNESSITNTTDHNDSNNKRKLNILENLNKASFLFNRKMIQDNQKILDQLVDQERKKKLKRQNSSSSSCSSSSSFTPSSSSSSLNSNEISRSPINFAMFACDPDVKELIFRRIYHILSPECFLRNGKTPPRGFLLHGPPGTGKTQLVYAIAGELGLPLLKVTSTELISGVSGESEENIRALFAKAMRHAPCILFIDEIEAISQRRETATKHMEHRIVTQLLACFDDLAVRAYVPVVVVGATNQVDSLDIGLRRAGRFDQEIPVGIPDERQRKRILEILCSKMMMTTRDSGAALDLDRIVMNTPGYVGADLNALVDEALSSALDRRLSERIGANKDEDFIARLIDCIKLRINVVATGREEKETDGAGEAKAVVAANLIEQLVDEIAQSDFDVAISRVQPSSKREGFATVPDVSWEDIGALQKVRDELKTAILAPVKYAKQCEIFNFTKPPGILMVGPPGCGKTLLAKAIAKESGVNFISVKGPELLNMYVGESERAVRSLFQRARNSKPCVIFFDEIDAICVKRSESSSDSGTTTRVVNQMLTEMDGLESRKGVFLMAASNRPDIIDPAILRPGRLDKIIYVGLPDIQDKFEILKTITKNGTKPKIDVDVDFEKIANDARCQTYTGADLSALVREASEFALKEFIKNPVAENEIVKLKHFESAFNKIKPSVSLKDCEKYEKMKSMCVNLQ